MDKGLCEEETKIRLRRFIVDIAQATPMQQTSPAMREAFEIMKNTMQTTRNLFPAKNSKTALFQLTD